MLSARSIFEEILDNDEAFQLFCSIAASGEAQGGWENGRIAALVPISQQDLAPKIARHGADEDKHGRIFNALLRKRGLEPMPVPAETDYTMRLETIGIGLAHSRLRGDQKLTEPDIIAYLAHSRVTEQRAPPGGDRPAGPYPHPARTGPRSPAIREWLRRQRRQPDAREQLRAPLPGCRSPGFSQPAAGQDWRGCTGRLADPSTVLPM